jgi:membrane-associated phospholipid phosphatase
MLARNRGIVLVCSGAAERIDVKGGSMKDTTRISLSTPPAPQFANYYETARVLVPDDEIEGRVCSSRTGDRSPPTNHPDASWKRPTMVWESVSLTILFCVTLKEGSPVMNKTAKLWLVFVLLLVFLAPSAARADDVTDWNQILIQAGVTDRTPPYILPRYAAIVESAVFDAVNGIKGKYTPVHVVPGAPPGASARAAAVQAAYTTLVAIFPKQKSTFDEKYASSLAGIASGPAAEHSVSILLGLQWGQAVANAILAWRATDGFNAVFPPYPGGDLPGQWRPTPPAFASGVALQFVAMPPFVLQSPSQFRPGPPPALTSQQYATDFNETKTSGSVDSVVRTADETLYAQFWQDATVTYFWNRVALPLSAQHHLTLYENARLLALLNLAEADAIIATFDAKYRYSFWRPVTAIRLADTDGNPATEVEPDWTPLIVTPAHPEYPSAHAIVSSAAAGVLAAFFGDNTEFSVDSSGLPGVTRSFSSLSAALAEINNARVFGGIHYRNSCNVGQAVGTQVANYVLSHALQSVNGERNGQSR